MWLERRNTRAGGTDMGTIAVIGATGTIGKRLALRLAAQSRQVRAICRNPGEWDGDVEAVAADLTDPEQALDALEGAEAVYLTPMLGGDDLFANERTVADNVVDAVLKHDVTHIVMHTAVRADRGDTGARILDNKTPIEKRLAESGVGYTILRPAWFVQNLWAARDYLEQGVVSMPWPGDMVWAATDIEDIVTAAVAFFDRGPATAHSTSTSPAGSPANRSPKPPRRCSTDRSPTTERRSPAGSMWRRSRCPRRTRTPMPSSSTTSRRPPISATRSRSPRR
jgi:uncharacterized protein YbjT (DUF2867 family)